MWEAGWVLLKEFQDVLEDIGAQCFPIQNGNLIHSGEINIVGAGCYQSTLQAGKGSGQGIFVVEQSGPRACRVRNLPV